MNENNCPRLNCEYNSNGVCNSCDHYRNEKDSDNCISFIDKDETQFLAVYADSEDDTVITVLINADNSDLAREKFNEYLTLNDFDLYDYGVVRIRPIDELRIL